MEFVSIWAIRFSILTMAMVAPVITAVVFAFAGEVPSNASDMGWSVAVGLVLLIIGIWVRSLWDKDKCRGCGMDKVERRLKMMSGLMHRLCEKNEINEKERNEIMAEALKLD